MDSRTAQSRWLEMKDDILPRCEDKQLLIVLNKTDLLSAGQQEGLRAFFSEHPHPHIFISAKNQDHITELQTLLLQASALPTISQEDVIVTNARHYEALCHALDAIRNVLNGLQSGIPCDLISEDLRQCLFHLSDIIGEVTTDNVLANIFKHFCIGK